MAIAYVGGTAPVNANNAAVSPTVANGAIGDFILAVIAVRSATATVATPGGWTAHASNPRTGTSQRIYVFWKIATATSEAATAFTPSGGANGVTVIGFTMRFSGVHATVPFGDTSTLTNNASATSIALPNAVTVDAGRAVVGIGFKIDDTGLPAAATATGVNITGASLTFTAGPGVQTATGNDGTLLSAYSISSGSTGTGGSFAPGGTAQTSVGLYYELAAAPAALSLTAESGAFALTGQAATLKAVRAMVGASGAFAFTGQTATFRRGYTFAAASGAFALTGEAATFGRASAVVAASGSIAFTGQDATLRTGRKLVAEAGAFAWTSQAATFDRSFAVAGASGSYAFTGQAATLARGLRAPALAGAFTLNGQTATTAAHRRLAAAAGSFALTGQDAALSSAAAYSMAAVAGAFALTGSAATLTATRRLSANAGSFSLTGTLAYLSFGYRLGAGAGVYAFTGQAADLTVGSPSQEYELTAETGAFALTGGAATLERSPRRLLAGSGAFVLAFPAVSLGDTWEAPNLSTVIGGSSSGVTIEGGRAGATITGSGSRRAVITGSTSRTS
jgi:hypothetical protein